MSDLSADLSRLFGMEVRVNRFLPTGSVIVVSPDMMHALRERRLDTERYVTPSLMGHALGSVGGYVRSAIGYAQQVDALRRSMELETERAERMRREFEEFARYQREAEERAWRRDWWRHGEERGWWEA